MQKHPPKHTRLLPVEVQGKPRPEDVEINKFLAIYNKTGNNLALWSALLVCLRHRRPVPDGLAQFFEGIAEKLLQFSADGEKEARQLVPDLVLGTKSQGGGPSVFQQFRQILEERQLLELIHSRMITHIVEACPPGRRLRFTKAWRTKLAVRSSTSESFSSSMTELWFVRYQRRSRSEAARRRC
ncbi:MAG: hypothetical protein WA624_20965 [Methylocella sp.]